MKKFLVILALLVAPGFGLASEKIPESCVKGGFDPVTVPAPVDIDRVLKDLHAVRTKGGKQALSNSKQLDKEIREVFDTTQIKTKMEQFFRLLYVVSRHIHPDIKHRVEFNHKDARKLLLSATVFSDPKVPNHINRIRVERIRTDQPKWIVGFDQPRTDVVLNNGEGFFLYKSGKCQHAKKLIFRNQFSVHLRMQSNGNLLAQYFKGVDLFGDFGNRGIVDVDIEYVEFRKVEFYKGTFNGKVTAYVSEEEFKQNDHSMILRFITRFVPDNTVQPIDW